MIKGKRFKFALSIFGMTGVVFAIYLFSNWSLLPFGKRYLPDYFFEEIYAGLKQYVPQNRLVFLNGQQVEPTEAEKIIGVSSATQIIEYSSEKAIEKFGESVKSGR